MTYNMTQFDWLPDFNTLFTGINNETSGTLAVLFLAVVYIISFISFKSFYDTKIVFLVSNFMAVLIAGLMLAAGWIGLNFLLVTLGLLVISIAILSFD